MTSPLLNPEGRRLNRQLDRLRREYPRLGSMLLRLTRPGWMLLRVPLGLLLILGGFLAILPVFGLWMIPVGMLLLAVDIPFLRRPVSAAIIRLRRRVDTFRQQRREKR